MTPVTINLTDDLKRLADTRAAAAGYASINDYVGALILTDAGDPVSPSLEAHLLASLSTPAKEISPAYWDSKKEKLSDIHKENRR